MSGQSWAATNIACATGPGFVPEDPAVRPAWKALLDWLRMHGLRPEDMPVENLIVRRLPERQVSAVFYEVDERGRRRLNSAGDGAVRRTLVVQLEAPPLPWPAEVLGVAS